MRINVLLNWADGNTWLGLLLFFVGLGLLVTIHELGHFIAAKSFKVYCSDFSIGFGPKIVKIKRKLAVENVLIHVVQVLKLYIIKIIIQVMSVQIIKNAVITQDVN